MGGPIWPANSLSSQRAIAIEVPQGRTWRGGGVGGVGVWGGPIPRKQNPRGGHPGNIIAIYVDTCVIREEVTPVRRIEREKGGKRPSILKVTGLVREKGKRKRPSILKVTILVQSRKAVTI